MHYGPSGSEGYRKWYEYWKKSQELKLIDFCNEKGYELIDFDEWFIEPIGKIK
jgi:hypothetical protein